MGSLLKTAGGAAASIFGGPIGGALASAALAPPGQRLGSLAGSGLSAGFNQFNPFGQQGQVPDQTPKTAGFGTGAFFTPDKQAQISGVTSTNVPTHNQGFFNPTLTSAPQTTTAPAPGPRFSQPAQAQIPRDPGFGGGFNFSSGGLFGGGNSSGGGGAFSRPIGGGFSISSAGPRTTNPFSRFNR